MVRNPIKRKHTKRGAVKKSCTYATFYLYLVTLLSPLTVRPLQLSTHAVFCVKLTTCPETDPARTKRFSEFGPRHSSQSKPFFFGPPDLNKLPRDTFLLSWTASSDLAAAASISSQSGQCDTFEFRSLLASPQKPSRNFRSGYDENHCIESIFCSSCPVSRFCSFLSHHSSSSVTTDGTRIGSDPTTARLPQHTGHCSSSGSSADFQYRPSAAAALLLPFHPSGQKSSNNITHFNPTQPVRTSSRARHKTEPSRLSSKTCLPSLMDLSEREFFAMLC